MQAFLTFAIEFVAVSGFALFSILFVSGYDSRKSTTSPALEIVPEIDLDMEPIVARLEEIAAECFAARAVEAATPIATATVVPFSRKAPDLSGLSIRQLKAIASRTKLPKYNKDSKAVLQERLSALPAWALREAVAA
jgi:hypothetical protein